MEAMLPVLIHPPEGETEEYNTQAGRKQVLGLVVPCRGSEVPARHFQIEDRIRFRTETKPVNVSRLTGLKEGPQPRGRGCCGRPHYLVVLMAIEALLVGF